MSVNINPARPYRVFSLIAAAFVLCLSMSCSKPNLPGDEEAFDGVAALPAIANFAGNGSIFSSMMATYVRPDGKVDLTVDYASEREKKMGNRRKPFLSYSFIIPQQIQQPTEKDNRPIGAGGGQPRNLQDEYIPWAWQVIMIQQPGRNSAETQTSQGTTTHMFDYNPGMSKYSEPKLIDSYERETKLRTISQLKKINRPPVPFSTVWQWAIKAGAPSGNAVAEITYYPLGKYYSLEKGKIEDSCYEFKINYTDYEYTFGPNGKLIK